MSGSPVAPKSVPDISAEQGWNYLCLTGTSEDGVTLTLLCAVWLTVISFRVVFFFPPLLEFDPSNAVSKQMRKTKAACVPGSFWTSCL